MIKNGDRVLVLDPHPWGSQVGTAVAYEKYGLGWRGWRVKLDQPYGQECYADAKELRKL